MRWATMLIELLDLAYRAARSAAARARRNVAGRRLRRWKMDSEGKVTPLGTVADRREGEG